MERLSYEEVLKNIDRDVYVKESTERVKLSDALSKISGEDIYALMDVPNFDSASVEGYAVNPGESLDEIDLIIKNTTLLNEGEATYVKVGDVVPEGTKFVIRKEEAISAHYNLNIKAAPKHINITKKGSDFKKGELILKKGKKINSLDLTILHSSGINELRVYEKPKILLMAIGDELVESTDELKNDQKYNSNIPYAMYRLKEWGYEAIDFGIVKDDRKSILKALEKNKKKYDLIITSGGMSEGMSDYMPTALEELEGVRSFYGIDSYPIKNTALYRLGATDVALLPGNPLSFIASFNLIIRRILGKISNDTSLILNSKMLVLKEDIKNDSNSMRIIFGSIKDEGFVPKIPNSNSSIFEIRDVDGAFLIKPNLSYNASEEIQVYEL